MGKLAAFHYFSELANRLLKAPFVRYVGRDELGARQVEKVFVSWENSTDKKYDHYISNLKTS